MRFPRGASPAPIAARARWGTADVLVEGTTRDVLVIAAGPLAESAVCAAERLEGEGLGVTVVDPRWLLPLDPELVARAAAYRVVLTVEDGAPSGGFGDQVARALRSLPGDPPIVRSLALPERSFLPAGGRAELLAEAGLDAGGIAAAVKGASPPACSGRP
jgi:1-deoxy-D-xylulose-5-phosphate synthase